MTAKNSESLLNATLAEYVAARLTELEGRKTVWEIAEEAGYQRAVTIAKLTMGESHLPIEKALPLARALEAPLLPFLRLVMAQYGGGWGELGDAICESVTPMPDPSKPRFGVQLERLTASYPTKVEMRFEVPAEFRRQFRIEGQTRGERQRTADARFSDLRHLLAAARAD